MIKFILRCCLRKQICGCYGTGWREVTDYNKGTLWWNFGRYRPICILIVLVGTWLFMSKLYTEGKSFLCCLQFLPFILFSWISLSVSPHHYQNLPLSKSMFSTLINQKRTFLNLHLLNYQYLSVHPSTLLTFTQFPEHFMLLVFL